MNQLYSKKVMDHFRNPRNMGEIKNPDGVATVGNPVCVLPDALVLANSRITRIKNIQQGNKVLSHDGKYHHVSRVFERDYSGKLHSIRTHNLGEVTVTPGHQILALKSSPFSHKFNAFQRGKILLDWLAASQLEKGDILLYPIPKVVRDRKVLKTKIQKLKWDYESKDIPKEISVDKEFLRLTGYYLAEGSLRTKVTQKALGFTFGAHENSYVKDVIFLMNRVFRFSPSTIRTVNNSTHIIYYSSQLVHFFEKLFEKGALKKHLPHWMMILPPDKQEAIICGLWRGDGYISQRQKTSKFVTISRQLGYQTRTLLLRQKIISSILTTGERGMHKRHYSIYVKEDYSLKKLARIMGLKVKFSANQKSPKKSWFDDNFYYVPIWKIKTFEYKGPVYNLEVVDSASYVSNSAILHNCGDVMKIYIKVENDKIKDIKFQTLGCGAAIATSSILTQKAKGKTLKEAQKIDKQKIIDSLGGLPPAKIHCSVLAADGLKKAITDYKKKQR